MKLLLIATTALVCVTSLAGAGALPERPSASPQRRLDTNGEFLCNYGFNIHASNDDSFIVYWERAATPIIGKGNSVNEIVLRDGPSGGSNLSGFQVALYSSVGGKPKTELVAASATQQRCGRVKVPIPPITLKNAKKYWVVETAFARGASDSESILWLYDKKRSHGALQQSGYSLCSFTCSSHPGPWTPIVGGVPYARVRESVGALEANRPLQSEGASEGFQSTPSVPITRNMHEGSTPGYPP